MARRVHRLPQRLDYNLIPAPLDLSLSVVTEKSPLPAIIVTPSSPSADTPKYYIAFLTPPKPSLRERILQFSPFHSNSLSKAKTAIIITLLLFVLACHLFVHLAGHLPHLKLYNYKPSDIAPLRSDTRVPDNTSWNLLPFDFRSLWDPSSANDVRSFIIEDLTQAVHR